MNIQIRFALLTLTVCSIHPLFGADLTGKLGMNYSLGPSFVLGGARANDAARVGPQVGAGLEYGITRAVAANFNYDVLEQGFQTQTLTFGGTLRPWAQEPCSPFFGVGMGFGHRYSSDGWDHFALKLSAGVEHYFTENVSMAALVSYFYVPGAVNNGSLGDVHALQPGVRMNFYFNPTK